MIDNIYNIIILIRSTGDRILLNTVYVEVELKHDTIETSSNHIIPKSTWMEITIKIYNPGQDVYNKLCDLLLIEEFYLYFQDVHPNLIKSTLIDSQLMNNEIQLKMHGNSTNKTYYDFLTEVTNSLNANKHYFESNFSNPTYPIEPESKVKKEDKIIKSKVTVLKRKLSF